MLGSEDLWSMRAAVGRNVFVGRERARREFHYKGRSERRVRDVSMVV